MHGNMKGGPDDARRTLEGDLIRVLDGESPLGEPGDDRSSAAAIAEWRRRSRRLSEMVGSLDPTDDEVRRSAEAIRPIVEGSAGPRAWRGVPVAWRIAAALTLIVATGLLVEPARAWLLDRVRTLVETLDSPGAPVVPDGEPVDPTRDLDFQVVVPGMSEPLLVEILGAGGTLIVRPSQDGDTRVAIRGVPDGDVTLFPGAVRVEMGQSGDAILEIQVGSEPGAVTIRHGD
ncbi:MAG TPA: hypothetical protein VMN39_05795, partial [Longimicrobiaceae bacterium]|nr:hypothetical protein [Longimicrobiaceae bacterium]